MTDFSKIAQTYLDNSNLVFNERQSARFVKHYAACRYYHGMNHQNAIHNARYAGRQERPAEELRLYNDDKNYR